MLISLISRLIILIFAVLHPAYKSYKSLRNKNQLEIVSWIMYWIVFALYTAIEAVTDLFFYWLPFYYELKILFILWMSLPVTRGYSVIFRKIIHPELLKHEPEIDEIIDRASEKGYDALLNFGAKGINFAATTVLSTAVKGQAFLYTRSLSLGDLSFSHRKSIDNEPSPNQIDSALDEFDDALSGHGDFNSRTLPRVKTKKRGYDTGTFPKRRQKITDSDLQILPEEEISLNADFDTDTKKDKFNISQIYLSAIEQKESSKRPFLTTSQRSLSDTSDQQTRTKLSLYRPKYE